jgi:UDP-N-acetylmuramyl pentapeptide phosphotransferase/UDP-N-acetylglucosamine-1-phosphate transferase
MTSWWKPLLLAIPAGGAAAAILFALLRTGAAWRLAIDVPNDRSLHTRPTPRVGGWGIVPVAAAIMLVWAPGLRLFALLAACLAAVSYLDDRFGLPAQVRFAAHWIAALAVLTTQGGPLSWWWLAGVAVLLVWVINLYNFMDGADGLAGGMALLGFGAYALAAAGAGAGGVAGAAAAVAGAAAGFLVFNLAPARVFLGDCGSVPLGFLAGALGYWGWLRGVWPFWFPLAVFAPFGIDATVTVCRRFLRGEKVWQAHREHYYQRMIRMDGNHARVVRQWHATIAAGAGLALLSLGLPPASRWLCLGIWLAALLILGWRIDRRWRRTHADRAV